MQAGAINLNSIGVGEFVLRLRWLAKSVPYVHCKIIAGRYLISVSLTNLRARTAILARVVQNNYPSRLNVFLQHKIQCQWVSVAVDECDERRDVSSHLDVVPIRWQCRLGSLIDGVWHIFFTQLYWPSITTWLTLREKIVRSSNFQCTYSDRRFYLRADKHCKSNSRLKYNSRQKRLLPI